MDKIFNVYAGLLFVTGQWMAAYALRVHTVFEGL